MSNQLLIHIGYHKTATTWMQQSLFMPSHGYQQICSHAEIDTHVVRPYGLSFDPEPFRSQVEASVRQIPAGRVPVISSEILSGNPFYGGRGSELYAERLRQILPHARILISIRNQMRILPSVYMQYLSRGGTMTQEQFFSGTKEPGYVQFDPAHFEYDQLVGLYRALFGEDRVFVLPQEDLLSDLEASMRRLARFCDNDEFRGLTEKAPQARGRSYPEYAAPFFRRLNHFRRDMLNPNPVINLEFGRRTLYRATGYAMRSWPLAAVFGRRRPISNYVRRTFSDHYTASNQRLREMLGTQVDLSGYE